MRESPALGFGGFLLGLGLGWYVFRAMEISYKVFAWILIIAGAGVVVSALISWGRPSLPLRGLVGGLMGGLILSLFLTSGVGFIQDITGGVRVTGGPLPYSKEQSKTFDGEADVGEVYFEVENVNGDIQVSTWDEDQYSVTLNMEGKGNSEAEASKVLDKVEVKLDEELKQGRLELILTISASRDTWRRLSIDISVSLPAQAEIDLRVKTVNGDISLGEVSGDTLLMGTTNGDLEFEDVKADTIEGSTTNGEIRGLVEAEEMDASATNGSIDLRLPCRGSGEYDLDMVNGYIDVEVVPSSDKGFMLDLRTVNGVTDIDLEGLTYETNTSRHKEAQTSDFEDRPIKIIIEADTMNGNVSVEAS